MSDPELDNELVRGNMQTLARYMKTHIPKKWGFVLLCFPFGTGGRMNYVSNSNREDVVRAMYEFINQTKGRWASHISGAKESLDTELAVLRQRVAELEEFVSACRYIRPGEIEELRNEAEELMPEKADWDFKP